LLQIRIIIGDALADNRLLITSQSRILAIPIATVCTHLHASDQQKGHKMLHAVAHENRGLYQAQLEQAYKLRYEIFVKERKWKNLQRDDQREIDQFDTEDAIHLLALVGDDQHVVGGCRLLPTVKPYLLTDIFPQLCQRPIPRGSAIFEWGRLYVAPAHREGHAMSVTSTHIMAGMVEFCLDHGIEQLAVVSELYWLPRFLALGLVPEPLGLPQAVENIPTIAYTLAPSEEALATIRGVHGFKSRSLTQIGISSSVVPHDQAPNLQRSTIAGRTR
jgi:acyl-homoserine lactone synthase